MIIQLVCLLRPSFNSILIIRKWTTVFFSQHSKKFIMIASQISMHESLSSLNLEFIDWINKWTWLLMPKQIFHIPFWFEQQKQNTQIRLYIQKRASITVTWFRPSDVSNNLPFVWNGELINGRIKTSKDWMCVCCHFQRDIQFVRLIKKKPKTLIVFRLGHGLFKQYCQQNTIKKQQKRKRQHLQRPN